MKRPKQSSPYEEKSDPMRDLDIELEGPDDDIIDLEDIIEMPDSPIDEDEDLDLDVELFGEDSDVEPGTGKAAKPPQKEQLQGLSAEAEDMMKSFGDEADEEEALFEQPAAKGTGKPASGKGEPQLLDQSLLDELLDQIEEPETGLREGKTADAKAADASGLNIVEESLASDIDPDALLSDESFAEEPAKAEGTASAPALSAADLSQVAEELLDRIDSSLQEHIRNVVGSMLPDIVRTIISEEVEKLKKELQ
jgi:hypothetical protein